MKYIFLALAIIFEVIGSALLKSSEGFTRVVPSVLMGISYLLCFYFLSHALKTMPLGIAYAIWAGLGIVLTTVVSLLLFGSKLDIPAVIGITLILAGVVILNVFSNTAGH